MATDDGDLFERPDDNPDPHYDRTLKDRRKIINDERVRCASCGSMGIQSKMHQIHVYTAIRGKNWVYVCNSKCTRDIYQHRPRDRSDRVVFEPEPNDNIVDQN